MSRHSDSGCSTPAPLSRPCPVTPVLPDSDYGVLDRFPFSKPLAPRPSPGGLCHGQTGRKGAVLGGPGDAPGCEDARHGPHPVAALLPRVHTPYVEVPVLPPARILSIPVPDSQPQRLSDPSPVGCPVPTVVDLPPNVRPDSSVSGLSLRSRPSLVSWVYLLWLRVFSHFRTRPPCLGSATLCQTGSFPGSQNHPPWTEPVPVRGSSPCTSATPLCVGGEEL